MAKRYTPVDLSKLKTYSVRRRAHRCGVRALAGLPPRGANFQQWWDALPAFLGADALKAVAGAIVAARRARRPVVFALGAHVVKVGCSPVVCDLIERGLVTAVAMNGATAIHDVELAMFGETSEEVAETIRDGRFGMVRETPAFFAEALAAADGLPAARPPEPRHSCRASVSDINVACLPDRQAAQDALPEPGDAGLGAALGAHLLALKPPHVRHSILAAARRACIPATVHVAVGTDTIHMHENVATSNLMRRSEIDFRIICSVVVDMASANPRQAAGVWCNVGSAVVLPEVFLKAVAVARNLGANLDDITTANFDMLRHYRPSENVIGRPVKKGRGHHIAGQHEIMLPLLRQALIELSRG